MNKEETRAKIQEVLTEGLFLNEDSKFDFESTFGEDLGLDSLDKIEVKLTIEDALDIMLPEDSFAGDVLTVQDAVELVMEHA
ncbi:phosphopantetheine-binding protein [bacterium]|nr:phosphopantetheine-binding protein [bacterium]|tara:strand:+ start:119 stop:364 length:246 start_codon:yes stop_codon:yes gene_type:complete